MTVRRTAFAALACLAATATAAACPQTVTRPAGEVRVIDGDSLDLGDDFPNVRLLGLDAFEARQTCGDPAWPCGQAATELVRAMVAAAQTITCDFSGQHGPWGRPLVRCAADGVRIGEAVLCQGLAVAWQGAADPDELACRDDAMAHGRGAWSGPFQTPADYRKAE